MINKYLLDSKQSLNLFCGAPSRPLTAANFKKLNLFRSKVRKDPLARKESERS